MCKNFPNYSIVQRNIDYGYMNSFYTNSQMAEKRFSN